LLQIGDPYVAYCIDEAAAELLSHKDPPTYPEDLKEKKLNNNKKLLEALKAAGGLKIETQEDKPPSVMALP
jgi:hypothetical protein